MIKNEINELVTKKNPLEKLKWPPYQLCIHDQRVKYYEITTTELQRKTFIRFSKRFIKPNPFDRDPRSEKQYLPVKCQLCR